MTIILWFEFSIARPCKLLSEISRKILPEDFSANWVKLAAAVGSLNQHSFL